MGDSLAVRRAQDAPAQRIDPGAEGPLQKAGPTTPMGGRARAALEALAARDRDGEVLTAVRHFPAREALWADFPEWVNGDLKAAYGTKGIARLYSHQAASAEAVHSGKNIVIVTPTASGKTLCYNLPVLNAV